MEEILVPPIVTPSGLIVMLLAPTPMDTSSLPEMSTFLPDSLTSLLPMAVIFSLEVIVIAPEALIEPLPLLMVTA